MIVTTAQLYKVAYGKFAVGAYNINNMEQLLGLFGGNVQSRAPFIIHLCRLVRKGAHRKYFRDHPEEFDFRGPGKIFVKGYADFIAHKNEKLGSAGQLDAVRASLKK